MSAYSEMLQLMGRDPYSKKEKARLENERQRYVEETRQIRARESLASQPTGNSFSWFNNPAGMRDFDKERTQKAQFIATYGMSPEQILEVNRLGPGAQEGITPTARQQGLLKHYSDLNAKMDELAKLRAEGSAAGAARIRYGAYGAGEEEPTPLEQEEDKTNYKRPFSLFHSSTWGKGAPSAGSTSAGGVIERKVGNRIALYDAKTKKPLGWKK